MPNPFTPSFGVSPPLLVGRDEPLERFGEALDDGPGSEVRGATLDGKSLDTGPKISGGGTAVLRVEYQTHSCIRDLQDESVALRLEVRTVIGTTKSEHLHLTYLGGVSTAPPC